MATTGTPASSCYQGGAGWKQYRVFLDSVGQRSTPVHQRTSMGGGLFVNSQLSPPTREGGRGSGESGAGAPVTKHQLELPQVLSRRGDRGGWHEQEVGGATWEGGG